MNLKVGNHVLSIEHESAVGDVIRVDSNGDAVIQFTTPPSANLPYGHIGTEFWPLADQLSLMILDGGNSNV